MGKFADELLPKFADSTEPTLVDFSNGSLAWAIQRYIDEMDGAGGGRPIKPLGESHRCTLRVMQRMLIGKKAAAKLTRGDIIELAKELRKTVVPATVNQYITYLRGVLDYAVDWDGCEDVSAECIRKAKKKLQKYNLIGKSQPRKRRPTAEEVAAILAEAEKYVLHRKCVIKRLPDVIAFALVSSRRRGEIVRITHGDVDYEKKIYWVRDIKHPTKKKGNDKPAVLWPELEEIIRRQPRMNQNDPAERIFPYCGKTLGKAYIVIKQRLKIENLRFHDCRRDAISRWLLKGMPPQDVARCVSLHDTTAILERNYDGRSAIEILQEKYADLMKRPEPQQQELR